MSPAELRRKAAELRKKIEQLVQAAETENREMNEDEQATAADLRGQVESLERRAKIQDELFATPAGAGTTSDRASAAIDVGDTIDPGETEDEKQRSFGDYLQAIVAITDRNTPREDYERSQDRLRNFYRSTYNDYGKAATPERRSLATTSGVAGGYTIPNDFRAQLMAFADEQAIVRPRATVIPMQGLEIEIPVLDQGTAVTGGSSHYGGILMGWTGEESDKSESEPKFKQAKLTAHELSGYCAVSRTLLMKSPLSIDALLFSLFGRSVAREEDRAFFRGNVGGKPLGIQFAPVTITTGTARGSATAISFANATAVWTRVLPESRGRGVWVASQSAESAVLSMAGTSNAVFHPTGVYTAATDTMNAGPSGVMLYMRPVLISSLLPTLNTAGDFGFYDFSEYLIGDPGLMEVATSEHYLFRKGQIAFRLIHYVGGMPWAPAPLMLDDGSTTASPFVTLAVQ
jgi:HK97 family phage major capsid protein